MSPERLICFLFAGLNLIVGGWALFAAEHFFEAVASMTGTFNQHFVRDVGIAFLVSGIAFLWAALVPKWRLPLVSCGTFFLVGHAMLHLFELATGALPSENWFGDTPGVFVPGLLAVLFTLHLARSETTAQ